MIKMRRIEKKAQQEMVGFVLIVVLVMLVALIFFILMVRKPVVQPTSIEVENLLSSVMSYTSGCAVKFEPQYDTIRDLAKSCYNKERCANLDVDACQYLEEQLKGIMAELMKTEADISGFKLVVAERLPSGQVNPAFLNVTSATCVGRTAGAEEAIPAQNQDVLVRLSLCYYT